MISPLTLRITTTTSNGVSAFYEARLHDNVYPGMFKTCERLTKLGCDKRLLTNVLKYCILNTNGRNIDRFITRSKTLAKVQMALELGLSTEEVSNLLLCKAVLPNQGGLPADLVGESTP